MTVSPDAKAIKGIFSNGTYRDSNKGGPAGAKEKVEGASKPFTAGCQLHCLAEWVGVIKSSLRPDVR
jgi:hypothetical protein